MPAIHYTIITSLIILVLGGVFIFEFNKDRPTTVTESSGNTALEATTTDMEKVSEDLSTTTATTTTSQETETQDLKETEKETTTEVVLTEEQPIDSSTDISIEPEVTPLKEETPQPEQANHTLRDNVLFPVVRLFGWYAEQLEELESGDREENTSDVSRREYIDEVEERSQTIRNTLPLPPKLIPASSLAEREVTAKSIVLVRCLFDSDLDAQSEIGGGSGVFISPEGHILTAAHVVRDIPATYHQVRNWTKEKCQIALTDEEQTPVLVHDEDDEAGVFMDVEVLFEPSDEEYYEGFGNDYALLKANFDSSDYYVPIVDKFIVFDQYDKIISSGYPSKIHNKPFELERVDGTFVYMDLFSAVLKKDNQQYCWEEIDGCGIHYIVKRPLFDATMVQNREKTEFGVEAPLARGGLSGGPSFYKGNLIGIATKAEWYSTLYGLGGVHYDALYISNSYEIAESMRRHGFGYLLD